MAFHAFHTLSFPWPVLAATSKYEFYRLFCQKSAIQPQETSLNSPLRRVLADSHISDVAIAALVLRSLDSAFRILWPPIANAATFLFTAIAILDVPYFSRTLNTFDRILLMEMSKNLISASIAFTSAWLLSRWMYGVGPIRSLINCCNAVRRSSHV
jgi:hypothetical protein